MACIRREKTGSCNHHQCGFSIITSHGYECVDIVYDGNRGYCEVGEDCISNCPFSWKTDDVEACKSAKQAFDLDLSL
jgi:hypothetical protein